MPATTQSIKLSQPLPMRGIRRLAEELRLLVSALLQPSRVLDEVEQMHELHRRAARLEASDPAQAARLRARMARIGL
ncbi:MAG: hypothetical protein JNL85_12330 [Rubrivivax sp.]|nr:hypothetical protein [Rubrivivax sp.]